MDENIELELEEESVPGDGEIVDAAGVIISCCSCA